MERGGWRVQLLTGVILLGALGVGSAGCSSGPSAAAKGLCGSVFGAPPPADEAVAISTQPIKDGENSGNATLDQAATAWIRDLRRNNTAAVATAQRLIVATCRHLGIPLGTYPAP